MNSEVNDKCLFEFQDVCDELKIKSILLIGTCLGLYRDKTYCEGDYDLDVGVFCDKKKLRELFTKLTEKEFEQKECWQNQGWELNQHFMKYGILLDVHFQYLKDEEKFFVNMDKLEYKNRTFNIPSNVEAYLELQYGTDWRTPKQGHGTRSRPLKGKRETDAGVPVDINPHDLNKYLQFTGDRYEGGEMWVEF